jgi:transcriptional regulator of arginine metabolism
MSDKGRRHDRILAAVRRGGVASQEQLAKLLAADGVIVTQATLSRDLRELGVAKGPRGYSIPGEAPPTPRESGDLQRALKNLMMGGGTGGNLAVLHTGPGRAPLLALEIDRAGLKPILGTIAGDDTIFVATRSPREAGRLLNQFKQLAGIS